MSKHYRTPPSSLWGFNPLYPKGFYFNRGIWLFGSMLESEMQAAENGARKRHGKKKGNADKFVQSERLRVLGKYLHEDIKRFRDPGQATNVINKDKQQNVEQDLGSSFFKLKTK